VQVGKLKRVSSVLSTPGNGAIEKPAQSGRANPRINCRQCFISLATSRSRITSNPVNRTGDDPRALLRAGPSGSHQRSFSEIAQSGPLTTNPVDPDVVLVLAEMAFYSFLDMTRSDGPLPKVESI